jgi:ATP-binding cassette subfamily B protein
MWGEVGVAEEDMLDADGAKQVIRRAARMLRPYRRKVVLASVLLIVWAATVLAGPFLVRYAIDEGLTAGDSGALNLSIALYVAAALIGYVVYRQVVMLISVVGESFLQDIRNRVFAHLMRLSMPFYDREKAGVVVSRMTSDVESLQELVQYGLLMFVTNTLLLVFSFVALGVASWQLLLVCLVALPPVILASIRFQRQSNKAYLVVRDRIGSTLSDLQQGITGVRVIQAFGREDTEVGRFRSGNRTLYDAHMDSVRIQAWYLPVIEFAGLGTTAAVVGVGGWLVFDDVITLGTVTFFVLTLSNLFEPVQQLSQLFNILQSAGAALNKLFELLDTPVDVAERPGSVDLPERGDLAVDGVSFAYGPGQAEVLRDVTLRLAVGERLALVGPTGAGKSTLAKLMSRLYDPTEGTVTFGGVDLRDARVGSLRRQIVVVPQEGFLFAGTVRDNVRVGRLEATDAEVDAAVAELGLLERFEAFPQGLDTEVRERGSRLSAGEKQLVSLARAALADPAVLVLDEATSSLDPGTEALVEAAVVRLTEGRTVVLVAHRLSTAERADRVAVVAGGRLVEVGPHAELVAQGGQYAAMYATWSGTTTAA